LEDNLTTDINVADVARVANTSPFYYQRMFMVLTNMSVQTYIRNRRMTLAAMDLQNTDIKVIDLAFKYRYESAEAFSRAFKRTHGSSPTNVRKYNSPVKAFLKLSIQVDLKGDIPMDYRIETKEGFKYYGLTRRFSTIDGANLKEIPEFWQEIMEDGSYNTMLSAAEKDTCLGVCQPMDPSVDTEFDYVIGSFSDGDIEGYDNYTVPAHEWAIFELRGPMRETIQTAWKRIFSEWFPQSGYRHADLPELEVYMEGDITASDYYMEIWIPIIK